MIAAPAFVLSEALLSLWQGFSVGVTEYVIQGLMLVVLCLVIRRFNWRFLLAFAVGAERAEGNGDRLLISDQ